MELYQLIDASIAALMMLGFIKDLVTLKQPTWGQFCQVYYNKYSEHRKVMAAALITTVVILIAMAYGDFWISFWVGLIQSCLSLQFIKTANTIRDQKWEGWYTLTVDGNLAGYGCNKPHHGWEVRIPYHAWSQTAKDFHSYLQSLPKAEQ